MCYGIRTPQLPRGEFLHPSRWLLAAIHRKRAVRGLPPPHIENCLIPHLRGAKELLRTESQHDDRASACGGRKLLAGRYWRGESQAPR